MLRFQMSVVHESIPVVHESIPVVRVKLTLGRGYDILFFKLKVILVYLSEQILRERDGMEWK